MKTLAAQALPQAAPIVRLASPATALGDSIAPPSAPTTPPDDAHAMSQPSDALERARGFARSLLEGQVLDTGEPAWGHAEGVAQILASIGAAPAMCAAAYLVYAGDFLNDPEALVTRHFGPSEAALVAHTRKLVQIQRAARAARIEEDQRAQQTERVRKMLLAFSRDLRVVLLRLASRLQTLRWHAAARQPCPRDLAEESQQVFAPLANRLGIWQIKWELEDLAFRFLQPEEYKRMAALLAERRTTREADVAAARERLAQLLADAGINAEVQGRPKHLYSIWKKMRGKQLPLERVFDVRALRVIVADVPACYAALAAVHARLRPLPDEFDDYIARPKSNGYQSLHTVVDWGGEWGDGRPMDRPVEIQIRTRAMHDHAEHGVAAHWAYKEAGVKGYAGVVAAGSFEDQVAEARKAVLRQLLAWERDFSDQAQQDSASPSFDQRIYVFTPQAAVVELGVGATAVDFAYTLHTELGHRCRGARVDGVMVPLNTALANGQTVEVVAAKDGGPSLDWLNPELGYLKSPRARAKVRAWFNAQAQAATIARGREQVEKLLQREGRTAIKLDELASQLGFKAAEALFEVVGKDEYSLRNIEQLLKPAPAPDVPNRAEAIALKRARSSEGGVLVVGVESLLTQLARCCRPAPPDAIAGYVTRGKGVAVHRVGCSNFRHMAEQQPDRVIPVAWGELPAGREAAYAVDVQVQAADRPGLLRDISEVLSKEKINVIGARTQTVGGSAGRTAHMTFTVEVPSANRLTQVLRQVSALPGIHHARRR